MDIKIGGYTLENDIDVKCIPDGWDISREAVKNYGISLSDFNDADYGNYGNIIVYN